MIVLDPQSTALVLIDLQKGIVGRSLEPYSGEQIIQKSKTLAERFRTAGAPVVLVNVRFSADFKDALRQPVDQPNVLPPGGYPADFSEIVTGLGRPEDLFVTKRQWGAFYGTDLDLQLRRRGIRTIVLGGVATNMGVESTARQAWEFGYSLVFLEDLTSSLGVDMHRFAFEKIFPRIGRVSHSENVGFS
ncbi:hydrolase [Leptospirillum ferriphilum]|jgi:nicotinamidase-related amidase|uniref:hydrolase n=1 Tax=Leptospirillum ferriphilum TaxID=178606 RepID=UPI003EE4ACC2